MKTIFSFLLLIGLASCSKYTPPTEKDLISVTISHHNGFSESVSSKERLSQYKNTDFLQHQPYQKVMRVCGKNAEGKNLAYLTSYYPSGQIKQYLEVIDNRAYGKYREWYSNGNLKLETCIIGGHADLSISSEKSWVFNGMSTAFNEEGHLIAEIPYSKGSLDGLSKYYNSCGMLQKEEPYCHGKIEGDVLVYNDQGDLIEKSHYRKGILDGITETFWSKDIRKSHESYKQGLLIQAAYIDINGEHVSSIIDGYGCKAVFKEHYLERLESYHGGKPEGLIQIFSPEGKLQRQYSIKNGVKDGEETIYSPLYHKMLSICWREGVVQGLVKTWYDNGTLESLREMSQNKKNGTLKAWYPDGSLMLVEEYRLDHLIHGEYFEKESSTPVSRVLNGKGCATFFDEEGRFLRKVFYVDGKAQS